MPELLDRLKQALADRYRLERELGAGGMATVYLAEDLKHERPVAIKVLRAELAAVLGPERFLREIKLTARLNHPHILPLLDSGDAGGFLYYVMPLVEGESLRDRLKREQQLPFEDALQIAGDVADALDYAHRHDVVHRDIKPENILLEEHHAVVADFGIARAVSKAGGERLTATGVAVGTPEYMSPEQASGRGELDGRSDVYALGCVVYEMLAGHPPFMGRTAQEVLARHSLDAVPSLDAARPGVPLAVARAVNRALAKVPADRFPSAGALSQGLRLQGTDLTEADQPRVSGTTPRAGVNKWRKVAARAIWPVLVVVALGYAVSQNRERRVTPPTAAVFTVALPSGLSLDVSSGLALAVSPAGDRYVFVGSGASGRQLYLRPVEQIAAVPLPGTEGAKSPFFSPDGQWVAFVADGRLKRVRLLAGSPTMVTDVGGAFLGGSWGPEDTIVFAQTAPNGIFTVAASGGTPTFVVAPGVGERAYWWPSYLPDGTILFGVATGLDRDPTRLVAFRPWTGERKTVLEGGVFPRYAASGHIVYAVGATAAQVTPIRAVAFDAERLRLSGPALTVLDSVAIGGNWNAQFDFSSDGSLVYVAANRRPPSNPMVWVDRQGRDEVIEYLPPMPYSAPMISPDGRRVGVFSGGDSLKAWLIDLERQTLSALVSGGRATHLPVWAPNGERIAFASNREDSLVNLYVKWIVGRSDVERLTVSPQHQDPASWSPDGKYLFYAEVTPKADWDIWVLDVTSTPPAPRPLLRTPASEFFPMMSPDGRWLAYVSTESGRPEVYADRFPDLDARQQVSRQSGSEPLWSPRGNELFYTTTDTTGAVSVWVVDVQAGSDLRLGVPRRLFTERFVGGMTFGRPRYDVTRDGQRFLIVRPGEPVPPTLEFVVVLNWFDELRRRVGPATK